MPLESSFDVGASCKDAPFVRPTVDICDLEALCGCVSRACTSRKLVGTGFLDDVHWLFVGADTFDLHVEVTRNALYP